LNFLTHGKENPGATCFKQTCLTVENPEAGGEATSGFPSFRVRTFSPFTANFMFTVKPLDFKDIRHFIQTI